MSKAATICMLGLVLIYSIFKLQDSVTNTDARHTHRSVAKYYLDTDVFEGDKFEGFQLAFGLINLDKIEDYTPEPEYGELKLYHKKWAPEYFD